MNYSKEVGDCAECRKIESMNDKRQKEANETEKLRLQQEAQDEFFHRGEKPKTPKKPKKGNEAEQKHCNGKLYGKRE